MADIGHGITFLRNDGTGTYATIHGLTTPAKPHVSRDSIDVTTTESSNRYREFIPGLRDAGDLVLEFNEETDDAGQALLYADYADDDLHDYRILAQDGTKWDFAGFITSIEPGNPLADRNTLSVTFKISGEPTLS